MSQVDNLLPDHIKETMSDVEVDIEGEINMDKVPFARNTIRMDLRQIDRNLKAMNAQNKENFNKKQSDENQNRACTPVNETETPGQPLTPTANLKVLFNAMSPELRNRDEQKRETSDEDISPPNSQDYPFEAIIEMTSSEEIIDPNRFSTSRKDKSLGLLCQKFLQKYPEYPGPNDKYEICLDAVAKELQVERRRIYDIVNVLESVEIVSRLAKNKYAWHGKSNLSTTLAKLKALGDSEGFGEQIQKLKNYEFYRELEEQVGAAEMSQLSQVEKPDFTVFGENSLFNQAALRKDKSLGIMSQKFLMLFLVSKPRTVNLDMSAKLLIGDANIDKTENAKFKTKIRRLYDIANILTSLDLIRKVHVTEIRGRKPAFKYVGPDIDACNELHTMSCCSDGCHRPISRHSMLDCIQNQGVAKLMNKYGNAKAAGRVIKTDGSEDDGSSSSSSKEDSGVRFGRHSSFEQLCAIAAVETDRMKASSEPASPVKQEKIKDNVSTKSSQEKSVPGVIWNKGKLKIISLEGNTSKPVSPGGTSSTPVSPGGGSMPTKGFVRKKFQTPRIVKPVTASPSAGSANSDVKAEAIIIKTSIKQQGGRQPTVIPLTKDQIDAVLRSLKVPVPVAKDSATNTVDLSNTVEGITVDSIANIKQEGMKEVNEKTPVITINTPERCGNKRPVSASEVIPVEKRIKLDFPSPPSSGEDRSPLYDQETAAIARFKRKISDAKPSPQRALHLAPEFANPKMAPSGDAPKPFESKPAILTIDGGKPAPKKIEIIINESTPSGIPTTVVKTLNVTNTVTQQSPVHSTLLNQQATYMTVPVTSVQGLNQQKAQVVSVPGATIPVAHNMQIIQASPGNGVQQVIQMPCTFSPPLTPKSGSPGTNVFTYSYPGTKPNTITLTNVQFVQPTLAKGPSTVATLIRPIATKAVLSPNSGSQIVPPQMASSTTLSPVTYLNKAPSGFVPIVNPSSNVQKIAVVSDSTGTATVHVANKLTDISALS